MLTVLVNGRPLDPAAASIGVMDAGVQHAVGLFETLRAERTVGDLGDLGKGGSRVRDLDAHVDRLVRSAGELGLSRDLDAAALAADIQKAADLAAVADEQTRAWRIRLTVTGGDQNLLARRLDDDAPDSSAGESGFAPTVIVTAQPATAYPEAMFQRGVAVTIAELKVSPLNRFEGHKTLTYWPRLSELQRAAGKRAAESLVFQVTNHLAGGCVSNALIIKDGVMITPIARGEEPASWSAGPGQRYVSPVLPGVTRAWALEWAKSRGIAVEKKMVTIDDVLSADELMLTNSSWGVLPVMKVEAEAIGDGVVGPMSAELIAAWRAS